MENIIVQEIPFGISIVPISINVKSDYYSVAKIICNDILIFYINMRKINKFHCLFRGTHFDKLDAVLDSGVDVTPNDAPIYLSSSPCKSIEYGWDDFGNAPRMLLLFYDSSKLKRTFVKIPSNSLQEDIDNLKKVYPIEYRFDKETIWLSRLAENDKRRASIYESEYGYWIPQNPKNALVWVMLVGVFKQEEIDVLKMKFTGRIHQ